jgi:hypothetical protein
VIGVAEIAGVRSDALLAVVRAQLLGRHGQGALVAAGDGYARPFGQQGSGDAVADPARGPADQDCRIAQPELHQPSPP